MKYFSLLFFCIIGLLASCSKAEKTETKHELERDKAGEIVEQMVRNEEYAKKEAVKSFIDSLSVEQKISQLFLVNIVGDETYVPVEKTGTLSNRPKEGTPLVPGGCLLFSYNIGETPIKLHDYILSVEKYCRLRKIVPPFIALDQEGGTVNRLRKITSPLFSEQEVAARFSVEQAYHLYYAQGQQLCALGVNLNLAPVVEMVSDKNRDFIGDRSFGKIEDVVKYSTAAINGYENSGVGAVLKHFPGNTNTDPHTGLPEIKISQDEIDSVLLVPFYRLTALFPSGVLMSHARVSSLDPSVPACISTEWVQGKLRKDLNYSGLIISDDIFMAALSDAGFPPEKAAVQAIQSGVDVLLLSEKRFGKIAGSLLQKSQLDPAFSEKINDAVFRVISFKIEYGILDLKYDGNGKYSVQILDISNLASEWKLRFDNAYKEGVKIVDTNGESIK